KYALRLRMPPDQQQVSACRSANGYIRPMSSLGQLFSQINLKKQKNRLIKAKAVFNLPLTSMSLYPKEKSHLRSLHL
ncbi:hypothetical protein, partial [Faecalibacterium prausnitzii]|uniref:hypothetical protein n=1 Tax=Faecalibacterium prausnitzii TaxID=853 RepID=UPI001A9A30EA